MRDEWDESKGLNIGGKIYCELSRLRIKRAAISIEGSTANVAYGAFLRSFKFNKYKTKKDEKITEVEEITLLVKDEQLSSIEKSFERLKHEGEGIFLARAFTTEPPNILYPESYANRIKAELTKLGLEVEVLDKKQMEEKKMGALLGVAQGSSKGDTRLQRASDTGRRFTQSSRDWENPGAHWLTFTGGPFFGRKSKDLLEILFFCA